jgi:NAD(P)-dependent dehydrogenase (short-subunit alcohol dehydrogenase family)
MTRIALITGASSGIGAEVARQLVPRGLTVLGTSRHPEFVTDPIPGVRHLELDQNDRASIARCAEQAGPVDILVNNAGQSQMGPLEDTPMAVIEKLFATNVFGPIALTKAVLPGMRRRGRGTVVMVGSMLASFPLPFRSTYVATKCAINGFADDSAYRHEYDIVAAATRRNEDAGLDVVEMAEVVLAATLSPDPKPLSAKGDRAPIVSALRRVLPRRAILDITSRFHNLPKVRQ